MSGLKLSRFVLQMRDDPANFGRASSGGRQEGLPSRHLRPDLEVARPAQERAETGSRPLNNPEPSIQTRCRFLSTLPNLSIYAQNLKATKICIIS